MTLYSGVTLTDLLLTSCRWRVWDFVRPTGVGGVSLSVMSWSRGRGGRMESGRQWVYAHVIHRSKFYCLYVHCVPLDNVLWVMCSLCTFGQWLYCSVYVWVSSPQHNVHSDPLCLMVIHWVMYSIDIQTCDSGSAWYSYLTCYNLA